MLKGKIWAAGQALPSSGSCSPGGPLGQLAMGGGPCFPVWGARAEDPADQGSSLSVVKSKLRVIKRCSPPSSDSASPSGTSLSGGPILAALSHAIRGGAAPP